MELLKVLVGSQAHGTATETSDYDYRGVWAHPTADLLKLGRVNRSTNWQEGKIDDTSWEIAHFLHLATRSNPTILEVFGAPIESADPLYGERLRGLLPDVWATRAVWNAFSGYARNKWRKVETDNYDVNVSNSLTKNILAAVRVLHQGRILMQTGEMHVVLNDDIRHEQILLRDELDGNRMTIGEALDLMSNLRKRFWAACDDRGWDKETDFEPVNEFLLDLRRHLWEWPED